jgi:hypothetical protein
MRVASTSISLQLGQPAKYSLDDWVFFFNMHELFIVKFYALGGAGSADIFGASKL